MFALTIPGQAALAAPPTPPAVTSPSISTTGLVTGQTNPNAITVSMTVTTGGAADALFVDIPSGWTWVTQVAGQNPCTSALPVSSVTGFTYNFCRVNDGSPTLSTGTGGELYLRQQTVMLAAGTTVTIVIAPNTVNVGAGTNFGIGFANGPTVVDLSYLSVGAAPASNTVVFNANGGSGTMADQSGSATAALTTNSFTRSGYAFTGWNTAADGTGTSYSNGGDYPFTTGTTLYAQWKANLASTGADNVMLALAGMALFAFGASFGLLKRSVPRP